MKKFLFICLLVAVLLIGGVIGLIMMSFNPETYEKQFITSLKDLTGRDVVIGGETSVQWRPVPTIVLKDVKMLNVNKSSTPDMIKVDNVRITLSWSSLFKTPFVIEKVELTRPTLFLERFESNLTNFSFPFLMDPNFQSQKYDLIGDVNDKGVKINSIVVRGGSVNYSNVVSGISYVITDIDGKLMVDSTYGPYSFNGEGNLGNERYTLKGDIGVFQVISPIKTSFVLSEKKTDFYLKIDGDFTPAKSDKWFEGMGTFSIGKVNNFLKILDWPELKDDKVVEGSLTWIVSPSTDTLKDLTVIFDKNVDSMAFSGTLERQYIGGQAEYNIETKFNTIDTDLLSAYIKKLNWNLLRNNTEKNHIAFKTFFSTIPWDEKVLKDVSIQGEYEKGVLTLKDVNLKLNGTSCQFTGKSVLVENKPSLVMDFNVSSEDIQPVMKQLYPNALKYLSFLEKETLNAQGQAVVKPDQIAVQIKEAKLNNTVVSGTIQQNTIENKKTYQTDLVFTNLDLDTYLGWKTASETIALSDLPLTVAQLLEKSEWANDLSVSGKIKINDGVVLGIPLSQLLIEGQLSNNVLALDKLSVQNIDGTDMILSTVVNGVGRRQSNMSSLKLSLKSKKLPTLLKQLNLGAKLPLIQTSNSVQFDLIMSDNQDGYYALESSIALSDAHMKLDGFISVVDETPSLRDMKFDIAHPNFKTFMGLFDPSYQLFPNLDGVFKAKGVFSGNKNKFSLADAVVGIGLQQLSGTVSVDNGVIKTVMADISSPSFVLDRFISGLDGIYSPVTGLSSKDWNLEKFNNWNCDIQLNAKQLLYRDMNIRQADVKLSLQNKELNLLHLKGQNGTTDKSPIMISGKFDWNTEPSLNMSFSLENMTLRPDFMVLSDLVLGGGLVTIQGDLKARGSSPILMAQSLNGQGNLTLQGGQLIGTDIEQMIPIITRAVQRNETADAIEPEFKRVLHSGKTILKSFGGEFVVSNGVFRIMDGTLKTANAVGNPTQIVWDISNRMLDVSVPVLLNPMNKLPPFMLSVSVGSGKGIFDVNYGDLISVLSGQAKDTLAKNLQQQQEIAQQEMMQKRNERLIETQKLTQQARNAVRTMEEQLQKYSFEKGLRLLEAAKDALVMVNQLAVREEPTDAQLIQQIEYARTVLLKADEFKQAMEQDSLFNIKNKLDGDLKKARLMNSKMNNWAVNNPDIVVLSRLAENTAQNLVVIEDAASRFSTDLSQQQMAYLLQVTSDALSKIEKAYQHAARFDLAGDEDTVTTDEDKTILQGLKSVNVETGSNGIRGSFKRVN